MLQEGCGATSEDIIILSSFIFQHRDNLSMPSNVSVHLDSSEHTHCIQIQ